MARSWRILHAGQFEVPKKVYGVIGNFQRNPAWAIARSICRANGCYHWQLHNGDEPNTFRVDFFKTPDKSKPRERVLHGSVLFEVIP